MANHNILDPEIINKEDESSSSLLNPEVINNPDVESPPDLNNKDKT